MSSNKLLDHPALKENGYLLADGATGTNLFMAGLTTGDSPELWNEEQPEKIDALHQSFVDAGSDIVLTNSFGGSRHRLKLHLAHERVGELNRKAASIARAVADRADRPILVAGSMGPTGELFEPLGPLTVEDGKEAFAEQAVALAEGGADVLWLETLSSADEWTAAVAGAAVTGLPIVATMTFDTNARTMMGLTPADYAALALASDPQISAFGANCGVGPAELISTVMDLTQAAPDAIIVAKGNCGVPVYEDGKVVYRGTPELMADYALLARDCGARIIGGCCGSTPEHLAAMKTALAASPKGERPDHTRLVAALGEPWGGAPAASGEGDDAEGGERTRRRRRRG